MEEVARVSVSFCGEKQLNKGRKRKINISEWKDNKRKALRNSGKEYVSRKGTVVPGKVPPNNVSRKRLYQTLNVAGKKLRHEYFICISIWVTLDKIMSHNVQFKF